MLEVKYYNKLGCNGDAMHIKDILDAYDIPYLESGHQHCRPGWLQLSTCPVCKVVGHYRLGFNLAKGYCSCWSCGYLPITHTLMELTGESYEKIRELLGKLNKTPKINKALIREGKLTFPSNLGELQAAHRKYLIKRGFDPEELIKTWGIKGIGVSHKLGWRIFIPVHHENKVVSWTTRALTNSGIRYLSAKPEHEEMPLKSLLYGKDLAIRGIIICEGCFDVWKIGPGAVCTFGTSYTRKQLEQIASFAFRVIAFDSEIPAQRKANKLCDDLSVFPGETIRVTLEAKDPGEAREEELQELRRLIS